MREKDSRTFSDNFRQEILRAICLKFPVSYEELMEVYNGLGESIDKIIEVADYADREGVRFNVAASALVMTDWKKATHDPNKKTVYVAPLGYSSSPTCSPTRTSNSGIISPPTSSGTPVGGTRPSSGAKPIIDNHQVLRRLRRGL